MTDGVVITGMGIVSPIGCDEATFWASLRGGVHGAREVTGFDTSELPRRVACQVRDEIAVERPMGRASALAVVAARAAMESASLPAAVAGERRWEVIIGTTMGETQFIEERIEAPADEWLSLEHAERILSGRPGCISRNVRDALGFGGVAQDMYGACAAGNLAIAGARRRLLSGACDLAVAGGADGFSRLAFIGFMRARVMATEVCRPFDVHRDGLLVGEGAAVFIMELESSARARGVKIRARILGCGAACEDYHSTRPHPDGDGLGRAMTAAMADAGARPEDVDYVCAHGTGTPQNDQIEVGIMQKVLRAGTPFSSIKALTGHMMGAAGAAEAAACVLSLEHQTILPTWNLDEALQPCSLDAVKGQPRPAALRRVLNNSAGFGGYNSCVMLASA